MKLFATIIINQATSAEARYLYMITIKLLDFPRPRERRDQHIVNLSEYTKMANIFSIQS